MREYKPHASSIGDAAANAIAVACYVALMLFWTFSFFVLLVVYLVEKKSGLVKFHTMQGMLLWLVHTLLGGGVIYESIAATLSGNITFMQNPMGWEADGNILVYRIVIDVLFIIAAIFGLVYAYRWRIWRVPVLGHIAALISSSGNRALYNGEPAVPEGCLLEEDATGYEEFQPALSPLANTGPPQGVAEPWQEDEAPKAQAQQHSLEITAERIYLQLNDQQQEQAAGPVENGSLRPAQKTGKKKNGSKPEKPARHTKTIQIVTELLKRTAPLELPEDDPNRCLPPEMRDLPTGEIPPLRRQGVAAQAQPVQQRRQPPEKPVAAAPKPKADTVLAMDEETSLEPLVRESAWVLRARKWAGRLRHAGTPHTPEPEAKDPNRQLPPEMRDPPAERM